MKLARVDFTEQQEVCGRFGGTFSAERDGCGLRLVDGLYVEIRYRDALQCVPMTRIAKFVPEGEDAEVTVPEGTVAIKPPVRRGRPKASA